MKNYVCILLLLIRCDDTEDALLLFMKDNITYKLLCEGFLNYIIALQDPRPLNYCDIKVSDDFIIKVYFNIIQLKTTCTYLIKRGIHKTELKNNPPESLKHEEPPPDPKKKKATSPKAKGDVVPPSKPELPGGVFGPGENEWTEVLNKVKPYDIYNMPSCTPLQCAVNQGDSELVDLLIDCHGNVSICDETGVSPLMTALSLGYDNIVDILINKGKADVNNVTDSGDPVIKYAMVSPDNEKVEELQVKYFEVYLFM